MQQFRTPEQMYSEHRSCSAHGTVQSCGPHVRVLGLHSNWGVHHTSPGTHGASKGRPQKPLSQTSSSSQQSVVSVQGLWFGMQQMSSGPQVRN